jgi:hypothetical protein
MKPILIFILPILLLSSCVSFNSEHKSSIKDVIDSTKCDRPCWLGIEPGMVLEATKVENILKTYYGEQNVILDTGGLNPRYGFQSIIWKIDTKSKAIPLQQGGVILDPNNQVYSIDVSLEEQWFTFGDLTSSIGEPDLVEVYDFNNYPTFSPCATWILYYPRLGLSAFVWQIENSAKIEKSDYISTISFSKPWPTNKTVTKDDFLDRLVSWKGYGDYSQYCAKVKTPNP